MILKYNKAKVYDPNAMKNRIRRATKISIDKSYTPLIIQSRAWTLINRFPFIRKVMAGLINRSMKFINLQSKEKNGTLYDIKRRSHECRSNTGKF